MTQNNTKHLIVTGALGFIGSHFVRYIVNEDLAACVTVIDKLTYAGCTNNFTADQKKQINFIHADICNPDALGAALKLEKNTSGVSIIHFAAESHVDRSIEDMSPFIKTNIEGTNTLLLGALRYFESLYSGGERENFRFLHVSTDEVYGALGDTGAFYETTQLQPNSPYSASKASSDHLVRAFYKTYGLPTLTTRCSNNYGPYQFPEKFIPVMILQAVNNKPLPVYGEGKNIRDWIHVDDHSRALYAVLTGGKVGEVYNIGGENERRNIDMAKTILKLLDKPESLLTFVEDRKGHDYRYAVNTKKIETELGWRPLVDFTEGLKSTIDWYTNNTTWWRAIKNKKYQNIHNGEWKTYIKL